MYELDPIDPPNINFDDLQQPPVSNYVKQTMCEVLKQLLKREPLDGDFKKIQIVSTNLEWYAVMFENVHVGNLKIEMKFTPDYYNNVHINFYPK